MKANVYPRIAVAASILAISGFAAVPNAAAQSTFTVTKLVSNQQGEAKNFDPDLVNAWGVAHSPGGPLWVNDNGTGISTTYGRQTGKKQSLTVTLPFGAGTGMVFVPPNSGDNDDFLISKNHQTASSLFIFVSETGRVEGWNPNVDPLNAVVAVNMAGNGSVFKGVGLSTLAERLYVADFTKNRVRMFDDHFAEIGSFTDPDLPNRFAPFNIAVIRGDVFVAFAKRQRHGDDDVDGPGLGYVDVFTRNGQLETRLVANGPLNAPWGMAIAPAGFGGLGGALLVGNFGDGRINAFDKTTGQFLGTLQGSDGSDLVIDGLWALDSNPRLGTVTFSAGPNDEANGLIGTIAPSGGAAHVVTARN